MSRRDWIRAVLITVVGGLIVLWIADFFGPPTAGIAAVIGIVVWAVFETVIRVRRVRIEWRGDSDEANDYGAQLATLMMMPLGEASLIRARVAKIFAPFQLSNAERSVLVRWATFPLEGTELKYEIEPIPGWPGRFRVQCYINYKLEPINGAVEGADAHRIVEAHKAMVARLLEERRPRPAK